MKLSQIFEAVLKAIEPLEENKQDYYNMFNDYLGLYEEYVYLLPDGEEEQDLRKEKDNLKDNIDKARHDYMRRDRIIWYLRLLKIHRFYRFKNEMEESKEEYYDDITDIEQYIDLENRVERKIQNNTNKFSYLEDFISTGEDPYRLAFNLIEVTRSIEHYLNMDIPEINDYEFNTQTIDELLNDLRQLERDYLERQKEEDRIVEIGEDNENVIINFNDGFAWWNLGEGRSDSECDAMGHCGTPQNVDTWTTLSLRERVGNEKVKPHVTAILSEDGYLLEIKGVGNNKPSSKFNKYMEELFMDDRIEGIDNSHSYMSENDFTVTDLPNWKELVEEKPELLPINDYIEHFGFDESLLGRIEFTMNPNGEQDGETLVFIDNETVLDAIEVTKEQALNEIDGIRFGGETLPEFEDLELDTIETTLNQLSDTNKEILLNYMNSKLHEEDEVVDMMDAAYIINEDNEFSRKTERFFEEIGSVIENDFVNAYTEYVHTLPERVPSIDKRIQIVTEEGDMVDVDAEIEIEDDDRNFINIQARDLLRAFYNQDQPIDRNMEISVVPSDLEEELSIYITEDLEEYKMEYYDINQELRRNATQINEDFEKIFVD